MTLYTESKNIECWRRSNKNG